MPRIGASGFITICAIAADLLGSIFLAYTLAGYLLIPYLIKSQLPASLSSATGITARLGQAHFDPFRFRLQVDDFSLEDPATGLLFEFEKLALKLAPSSLFQPPSTFTEIRLSTPRIFIERYRGGGMNYDNLLDHIQQESEPAPPQQIPPFRIQHLQIQAGELLFRDHQHPFESRLAPLDIDLHDLSTLPDEITRYQIQARSDLVDALTLAGEFSLRPLKSVGNIQLAGIKPGPLTTYLNGQTPITWQHGNGALKIRYTFDGRDKLAGLVFEDGRLQLRHLQLGITAQQPSNLTLETAEINGIDFNFKRQELAIRHIKGQHALLNPAGSEEPVVEIPRFNLDQLNLELAAHNLDIMAVASSAAHINVRRRTDGHLNIQDFLPQAVNDETQTKTVTPSWRAQIGSVALTDFSVRLEDQQPSQPVALNLTALNASIDGFSIAPGNRMQFKIDSAINQSGQIQATGEISLNPPGGELDLTLQDLPLKDFQAYAERYSRLKLETGTISLDGRLTLTESEHPHPQLTYRGNAAIRHLRAPDPESATDPVRWRALQFEAIDFSSAPDPHLTIGTVIADRPFAHLIIEADRSLSLSRAFPALEQARSSNKNTTENAFPVQIKTVHIRDGSVMFADRTLTPNFQTDIKKLNGTLKNLSSDQTGPADLYMEGLVDDYAPVKIQGQINPFGVNAYSNIDLHFRNLSLTAFTPYSGKFAGYRIDKGKMALDLKYTVSNRQLQAENTIILDQLTLGERVESPEATSLPLRLAIALLKDSDGRINLNLPIRGNIDDPQFSIGGLLRKALFKLITKVVTAPFTLLGGLVGNGAELSYIDFDAGETSLDVSEQTKLHKIAEALRRRPQLRLEIAGIADPKQDRLALAEADLLKLLAIEKNRELGRADSTPVLLPPAEYQRLLIKVAPRILTSGATANADHAEKTDTAPSKQRILNQLVISETRLKTLALERARVIRDFLAEEAGLSDERIYLIEAELIASENNSIQTHLSLTSS